MKDAQVGRGKIETSECVYSYRYSLTKTLACHATPAHRSGSVMQCMYGAVLCSVDGPVFRVNPFI